MKRRSVYDCDTIFTGIGCDTATSGQLILSYLATVAKLMVPSNSSKGKHRMYTGVSVYFHVGYSSTFLNEIMYIKKIDDEAHTLYPRFLFLQLVFGADC